MEQPQGPGQQGQPQGPQSPGPPAQAPAPGAQPQAPPPQQGQPVYQQPAAAYPPAQPALPNAPGAVAALVLGIISVALCGVPTGPFAIWQGRKAEAAIRENPGVYGGEGMAKAGWITGIIGTVIMVGWIIYWVLWILFFGAAILSSGSA